jgi:pimeloyl-ACP methyl ester carboxylesterase
VPTADLGEVVVYYEEHGAGEPVLLAAPSWWPCDTWKVAVVPALSRKYRTIIYDCRGTGYSGKPQDGYTIDQFARDSLGLLAHLKIPACHLVGFALGGQIVQAMAIERADLVATLTMAAVGAGMKSTAGTPRGATADEQREIHEQGFERFIRGHVDNTHMAFGADFYHARPDVVAALSKALWERQTSPAQFGRHSGARRTWDTLGNAEKVKVPTLVLCGAGDEVDRGGSTPLATARRLAELVPGAQLALIPAVKHMTFWDGGGALAALEEFLARHPIPTGVIL